MIIIVINLGFLQILNFFKRLKYDCFISTSARVSLTY